MTTESLSDKERCGSDRLYPETTFYYTEDVREAIKKLKELLNDKSDSFKSSVDNEWDMCVSIDTINEVIDEIFGEKLI